MARKKAAKREEEVVRASQPGCAKIAYCWRTGELEFTDHKLPDGALIISKGRTKAWEEQVRVLCRLGYDNTTWFVPGVPEAESDQEALDAVMRFIKRLNQCLKIKEAQN